MAYKKLLDSALRRREACKIGEAISKLAGYAAPADFAVYTYPVVKQINDILAALVNDAEGNTREILRQLRNTLMNGGWNKYRDGAVRQVAREILTRLAEADTVLAQEVDEAFDRLCDAGLNPVGASLLADADEDQDADAQEKIPG
jgi:hypothetical protein